MSVDLSMLRPIDMHLGADPDLIDRELIDIIVNSIKQSPRTQQRAIGPSEMGSPCLRKIGYRLANVDPWNVGAAWLPAIGTAVHAAMAETFALHNLALGYTRYLIEQTVAVGEVDGVPITGTCDLYDRVTACVIDWKCVGITTLRNVKRYGISRQYRMQAHLYGRGFRLKGVPVERVAIMYLPRNAELRERMFVSEPYDETIALQALELATGTAAGLREIGPDLLALLPTADDHCESCAWFNPLSSNASESCPGVDGRTLLEPGGGDTSETAMGIIAPD
jgi:hypothetical protein